MPGIIDDSLLITSTRRRRRNNSDNENYQLSSNSSLFKRARYYQEKDLELLTLPVLPNTYRSNSRSDTMDDESDPVPVEHHPGSIVRVKMTNFVTYTSAEFCLGPSLNMIIGPNGTGKSTLVCAICLGLGWGPNHLGRAKEVGEFVKHGHREATIEIELKAGPLQHGRNPIIIRKIKRESNKSIFSVNGKTESQKEVLKLARSFSIQIDNLCQFLPQDRVVEFAALSPIELLTSTQRAAAPEFMIEWHEELKKLREDQKIAQAKKRHDDEHLRSLENRQAADQVDVDRFKDREKHQEKLNLIEKARPLLHYKLAEEQYNQVKENMNIVQQEYGGLENELEPLLSAVSAKQSYYTTVANMVKQRQDLVRKTEQSCATIIAKQKSLQDQVATCEANKKGELEGRQKANNEIRRIQNEIRRIEIQMAQEPPEFDPAEYNERIREKTRHTRTLETQAREIQESMREYQQQAHSTKDQILHTRDELRNLQSNTGQQVNKLRRLSRDAATAWAWVQENQNRFKEKVFGPPIVECSIKDAQYADAVESVLGQGDFLAFTCTNRDDMLKLQAFLLNREHLNLSNVSIRTAIKPLNYWVPSISHEELDHYGLDGWLLDYIVGPEPVLSVLCDVVKLHATAVTLQDHNTEQFNTLKESYISTWVAGRKLYRVTRRREYGPNAVSTRVQHIRRAQFWTQQGPDTRMEGELNQRINELTDQLEQLEYGLNSAKDQLYRVKEQKDIIQKEQEGIRKEKDDKQRVRGQYDALPNRRDAEETKLASIQTDQAHCRERIGQLIVEENKLALQKAQMSLNYVNTVETTSKAHFDLFEAEILLIEAKSEYEILSERNADVKNMLEAKEKEVQAIHAEFQQARQTVDRYKEWAQRIQGECSEEEIEILKTFLEEQPTIDTLEAEVQNLKNLVDLMEGVNNPNLMRDFENRNRQIEKLRKDVTNLENELNRVQAQIDHIKGEWEPRLDTFVGQISDAFSHNFQKIGCAGQVSVFKDEDFSKWAIQIQVKFRENEQLSLLDSHRQSGGERAVSTIFYLMALQSLARAPFRVVDEINQGMDPRNERMVHERMVDIACREHTSQYFLITPKLLTGLKFHKRMKVHCIASGEYMPPDYKDLDFANLLKIAHRVKGVA